MRGYENSEMRTLQFLITEQCNLNCVYCYEKNKSNISIDVDLVKAVIRDEMLQDNGYKELTIDFFGGEPLLEFEIIREVVEWFQNEPWPPNSKAFRFSVTSNGTLLNDEMKAWFSKYSSIVCLCLSMDGNKHSQDINRSDSYDSVIEHADFVLKHWPGQPIKMTISDRSIGAVYDDIRYIHDLGFSVVADVVFENVWGDAAQKKRAVQTFAEQLDELVNFYYSNPDLSRPELVCRNIKALFEREHTRHYTSCGAGKHLTCWTASGEIYPCMRFAPICSDNPLKNIDLSDLMVNTNCEVCAFEALCPQCEGHNYEATGSCFKRTDFHCEFFKLSLLASAKLFFMEKKESLVDLPWHETPKRFQMEGLQDICAILAVNDLCADLV